MRIVPVTPDLIPALSDLAAETFTETFGHLYPPEDLSAFLHKSYAPETLLVETANPKDFWRIVLDETGEASAYLQCGPVGLPHGEANARTQGELKRIYVRASQQGKGLGKTLMTLALDHLATAYGAAPQWIGVWSENHKAQALYASYGFQKIGEYQFKVGKTLDDEFILRRLP